MDIVQHGIMNAVSEYEAKLCNTIVSKYSAIPGATHQVETSLVNALCILNDELLEKTVELKTAIETVNPNATPEELLDYYHNQVEKKTEAVRAVVDKLELLTATKYWPYPTFTELLFSV